MTAVVVAVVVTGCGGSSGSARASTGSAPTAFPPVPPALPVLPPARPISWAPCSAHSSLQCGTVSVPVDYRHPAGGSLSIAVSRSPALDPTDPKGTLVFNPGGPGESGNQILPFILGEFPPSVRRLFDIVTFDPRGTGASDPLQCGTSPSAASSVLPVPDAPGRPLPGTPVFAAMARACQSRAGRLAPQIDTVNTARDLDRIRQALGLATISFYGLSYGTVLGAVYADLFPDRVSTMVLDGAVDVDASLVRQATEEAPAAERSLQHLFATCSADPTCPLGSDPRSTFDKVDASLASRPLPAPGDGDPNPVTVGDLDTATLLALSVPSFSASYEAAVVAAGAGNGAPLRSLALEFVTDIDGAPLVDPLWAITCNDAAVHPGPLAAGALASSMHRAYPLIGAYSVTYTMGGCVTWPKAREPVTDLHPRLAPPVLVIGTTGDPNTPFIGAVHLAAIFPRATLLTWSGWGHTWLLSGANDSCMQALVTTYVTGDGLPHRGTVCH